MRNFFKLEGVPRCVGCDEFLDLVSSGDNEVHEDSLHEPKQETLKDLLYKPDKLDSPESPRKWIIRDKHFINVSFSKTELAHLEFSNCCFEKCLFIASVFKNCRFQNCRFVSTNMHRVEFSSVFIDPKSFQKCLNPTIHQNIGVHLYQELLRNSRQETQPDFEFEARFQFRRWQRWLKQQEVESRLSSKISKKLSSGPFERQIFKLINKVATMWTWREFIFEVVAGSGVRLKNLATTSICVLSLITLVNWYFRDQIGITSGPDSINNLVDSFYFSTIVVTSLGFGDIVPATILGRVVIAIEAILGFVLLATLASMIFRRISV